MPFFLINKQKDFTSQDVVSIVKKTTNSSKAGHSGTLDPFATGLLIVATNEHTKFLELFLNQKKSYEGEIEFGISTDTFDIEGKIVEEKKDFTLDIEKLKTLINKNFIGKIKQIPPAFSAIKVNGKKSYELARQNIEVNLKPVEREIYNFELSSKLMNNKLNFKVEVSSGTYIRALVRDISKLLDIPARLFSLKRTKIGIVDIKDSQDQNLTNLIEAPFSTLIPFPTQIVDQGTMKTLLEGKSLNYNTQKSDLIFESENAVVWAKAKDNKAKIFKRIK